MSSRGASLHAEEVVNRHILYVPVSVRRHEVEAAVDAVVLDVLAIQTALVREVLAELLVDVGTACPPAFLAVYGVPETYVTKMLCHNNYFVTTSFIKVIILMIKIGTFGEKSRLAKRGDDF